MYEESSPRRRRKRRRENPEYDDAWGAAFDEASFDEGIDPGAMAAGATYEDRERYARGYEDDDDDERERGALPRPPLRRRAHRDLPRAERIRRRYDRTHAYSQSPSFRRSQQGVVGRLADRVTGGSDAPDKPKRGHSGLLADLPFWGVAMLVFLGMAAILAVALTCIAALVLLG